MTRYRAVSQDSFASALRAVRSRAAYTRRQHRPFRCLPRVYRILLRLDGAGRAASVGELVTVVGLAQFVQGPMRASASSAWSWPRNAAPPNAWAGSSPRHRPWKPARRRPPRWRPARPRQHLRLKSTPLRAEGSGSPRSPARQRGNGGRSGTRRRRRPVPCRRAGVPCSGTARVAERRWTGYRGGGSVGTAGR